MYCTPLEKRMQRLMKRVFALLLACLMLCSSVDLPLVFASADGEDPVDPTGNTTETTIETTTEVTSESTTVTTTETTQSTSETTKETTQETTQETTKETTQETTKETVTETTTEDTSGTTAQTTTETTTAPSTQAPANGISDDDLTSTGETDPQTGDVNISQYASDLYIYNYNRCSASGTGDSIPFNGKLTGTTSERNVFVGDKADASGEDAPIATDIPLSVDNLHLQGTSMTINPVYHGSYQVHMTVAAVSSISNLVLNESAKLSITLNADLSVENLNLATGSSLTIHTNGHTLTISGVTRGSGSLTIDGAGGVNVSGQLNAGTMSVNGATLTTGGIFCDGTMTLTDATVSANDGSITAAGDITVSGGSISNASLFGYGADASGNRTITLSNAVNFSDVAVVGAAMDCPVQVTLAEGSSYNVASSTYFTWDYPICYYVGSEVVVAEAGWPVVYRSQNETFAGYFFSGGAFTKTDRVDLPTPVLNGFTFGGWKLNNAGDIVAQLTGAAKGPLSYHAQVEAKDVTVNYDLTFTPSTDNTDDPNDAAYQLPQVVKKLGETVNLTNPYQFGYEFQGWTPDDGTTVYKDSYTLSYQDVTVGEAITLKAVFAPVSFPVQVQIPSVAVENLQIRNSSEAEWVSPAAFDEKYDVISWDNNLRYFQIDAQIAYGESLAAFFTRTMGGYPQVQDINAVRAERQVFGGWATFQNTTKVSPETLCNLASGILEGRGDKTLSQFQTYLASEGIKLLAQWRDTAYTVTTDTSSAWKIYLGDSKEPAVPDANGQLKDVPAGTLLTWECSINDAMGISNWRFASVDEGKNQSAYNQMVQQTVAAGEQVVCFTMTMPTDDLYAACRYGKTGTKGTEAMGLSGEGEEQIYVNLTNGSVTFAEGVTHKGLTKNGFWYAQPLSEMNHWFQDADGRYFYTWDSSKTFGVTTSAPTSTNKLTLINSMTVKLKNVQLTATADFAAVSGNKLAGRTPSDANGLVLEPYGNIILDNAVHPSYTTNLIFEGQNTVGAIVNKKYNHDEGSRGILNINGIKADRSTSLSVGTLFGNFEFNISNLTIHQYMGYTYLLAYKASQDRGSVKFTNCTINARDKELYESNGTCSYTDCDVYLKSQYVGNNTSFNGKSYGRYYGSIRTNYGNVSVYNDSSLVVDGNIEKTWCHESRYEYINTTGYVIVKGSYMQYSSGAITKGTVITNALFFGRQLTIGGGNIITNVISNNALYVDTGNHEAVSANGDNYPFLTYSQKSVKDSVYSFSGGNIYLFGYYGSGTTFDTSIVGTSAGNPVAAYIAQLTDEDGNLIENPSLAIDASAVMSAGNADKECLMLGNSTYEAGQSKGRKFQLTGAHIFAAGNVTFFNDTYISGGSITAGGNVTSKKLLEITGGTINAKTVGNSCSIKKSLGDGLYSWQNTVIKGGTLNVQRIGAPEGTFASIGIPNRSNLMLTETIPVNAVPNSNTVISQDVLVNYVMDDSFDKEFNAEKNPENLRFENTYANLSKGLELTLSDDAACDNGYVFTMPKLSETENGEWILDNDTQMHICKVSKDALPLNKEDGQLSEEKLYLRNHLALYAIRDSYELTLKALDNATITVKEEEVQENISQVGDVAAVSPGAKVTIALDSGAMLNKTVIWYYDGNGVIHNALAADSVDSASNTITFTMPYADTEIWIADTMTLDLYHNELSFFNGGFCVEYLETRADSKFQYQGNIVITQSNITSISHTDSAITGVDLKTQTTANRIRFASDFTNAGGSPVVTVTKVVQSGLATDYCVILEDHANVTLTIQGTVQLYMVQVPENANFTAVGASGSGDAVKFKPGNIDTNKIAVGNSGSVCGSIRLENLKIITGASSENLGYIGSTKYSAGKTVTYKNCTLNSSGLYNSSLLASCVENVEFTNCQFTITTTTSWPGSFVRSVANVNFENSNIHYKYCATSTRSLPPFYVGRSNAVLTLDNSTFTVEAFGVSSTSSWENRSMSNVFAEVIVNNGSTLNVAHRAQLNTLTVNSGTVNITHSNASGDEGYLLCKNLDMNGGTINAGYVILSGFYATDGEGVKNKDAVLAQLAANTEVYEGGSLTMTGGTINAADFLGGDRKATLNISGGTVTSNRIGTYGALFGYAQYIPDPGEEYVYKYTQNIPQGTKVNISGGEVNVTEGGYLGGWGTDVNISGGEVDVANNAVLGLRDETATTYVNRAEKLDGAIAVDITDDARITGSGSISTPGNDTTISGNSAVKIGNILAKDGNINISTTNKSFDLGTQFQAPYNKAGVDVSGTIKAQNVTISGGAVVYANEAYVESGDKGVLTVKGDDNHLCIGISYGVMGAGNVTIDTGTDDVTTNIHLGNRVYKIYYDLNDTEDDPATEGAGNPTSYNPADGVTVALTPPTRKRFNFKGWKNEQGNLIANDTLHLNAGEDMTLTATWEPKEVTFRIAINTDVLTNNFEAETAGKEGEKKTVDGKETFIFTQPLTIAYQEPIVIPDASVYNLVSFGITALKIGDAGYTGDRGVSLNQTKVSAQLMDYFLSLPDGGYVTLLADAALPRFREVTLSLNQKGGRPVDAQFVNGKKAAVAATVELNAKLSSTHDLLGDDGELLKAEATGYTFGGWYGNEDCTGGPITKDYQVTQSSNVNFFAKWTANEYQICFDAGDGGVIDNGTDQKKQVEITYDQIIAKDMELAQETLPDLPEAHKDGMIFKGWRAADDQPIITTSTELNKTAFGMMDLAATPSLTLYAVYEPVTINYQLNGGSWKAQVNTQPGYGDALAGYTKAEGEYQIISTDAEYFANNTQYVANDYRHTLIRKGYTFGGWYTDEACTQEMQTIPQNPTEAQETITLYAKWTPNTYTLILNDNSAKNTYAEYGKKDGNVPANDSNVSVTVEKVIGNETNWPERDEWYAYNRGSEGQDKRLLLGFTFFSLEPGETSNNSVGSPYYQYGEAVKIITNNNALMTKTENASADSGATSSIGSTFGLPADGAFEGIDQINGDVPDYPNGSTITMYAVYRERSLVFIERLTLVEDNKETKIEQVLHFARWDQYSDFPKTYSPNYPGYSLLGWYVNDTTEQYPADTSTYTSKYEQYAKEAQLKGSYDIKVYTRFAAQDTVKNYHLQASSDPTKTNGSPVSYILPGSMQQGVPNYKLTGFDGLNIVGEAEISNHRYDSQWTNETYSADDTVAIKAELIDSGNTVKQTVWLTKQDEATDFGGLNISKGWKIQLTLYHSSVMTEAAKKNIKGNLELTFPSIQNQKITFQDLQISLTPSMYTVYFKGELAQPDDQIQNSDWTLTEGFVLAANNLPAMAKQMAYGSKLPTAEETPVLLGYQSDGKWTCRNAGTITAVDYGGNLTYPVSGSGAINLSTTYTISSYKLSVDTMILDAWDVKVGEQKVTNGSPIDVTYRTLITFTPKSNTSYPEFIMLEELGLRLDAYEKATNADGTYTFTMPATDVTAKYSDVMELDLAKDNISIDQDSFFYQGKERTWNGKYRIIQSADTTANTLTLAGDLGERVALDKLNITASNSINLTSGSATLIQNDSLTVANIAVGSGAQLVVNGNGKPMHLNLAAGSSIPGIGSAAGGANTSVTLNGCNVSIKQYVESGTGGYNGTWIGGNGIDVTVKNSTIQEAAGSATSAVSTALAGNKVIIEGSCIGTETGAITSKISAVEKLEIKKSGTTQSQIHMQLSAGPALVASGAAGEIQIGNATVVNANLNTGTDLYQGTMKILSADADVVIANTQILEMKNGAVTIEANEVTQDPGITGFVKVIHNHSGAYLLLNELDNAVEDVTINAGTSNPTITVDEKVSLDTLSAKTDAKLNPQGLLTVNKVTIAEAATLAVTAEEDAGLEPEAFGGDGSYSQTGGKLEAETDLVVGGNVALDDVTVTASEKSVGSSGKSGVTTVYIEGSTIRAQTIGAIGAQNDTFTFVTLEGTNTLNGMLVQDHYRLAYVLEDANFQKEDGIPVDASGDKLPTVLRSSTVYTSGIAGTAEYAPSVPGDPKYQGTGTSYFGVWYYEENNTKIAVSTAASEPGFTRVDTLDASTIACAEDTDSADATKTLTLNAQMSVYGTGTIASGRLLNGTGSFGTTANIPTTGAWTAKFQVEGALVGNFQFTFDQALPAGTQLTLVHMHGGNTKFYYHSGGGSTVSFAAFKQMGGTAAPDLGETGCVLDDTFLLTADFSRSTVPTGGKVTLQVTSGSSAMDVASVNYTVSGNYVGTVTATETAVTTSFQPNGDTRLSGKKLYLVAELNTSVPYGAEATLTSGNETKTAKWLGGNLAVFEVGTCGLDESTYNGTWQITGMDASYNVTWHLTASDNADNVFHKLLASANSISMAGTAEAEPSLAVTLDASVTSRVFTAGAERRVSFRYETNAQNVTASVEKQGTLAQFTTLSNAAVSAANGLATATIPAEAGTYRVCFSLNENSKNGNVYFTFIVEAAD